MRLLSCGSRQCASSVRGLAAQGGACGQTDVDEGLLCNDDEVVVEVAAAWKVGAIDLSLMLNSFVETQEAMVAAFCRPLHHIMYAAHSCVVVSG